MIRHVCIVLLCLWLLCEYNLGHPVAYFVSLIHLYLVHERYVMRLRKKLEYEGKRQSNQRRVLTDSETVRWLNHAVQKLWPVCVEQIVSQKLLLPIIPWFLAKYKPWTLKEAKFQTLCLGKKPPLFTEIRILHQTTDEDHLVLQVGVNFLTAGMSSILAVKLRKRLGFGISTKLHLTGMHLEGKLSVGVKFTGKWPFLERIRVCFAEPPHFQMVVRSVSAHGLDVSELPGIAGWLDKLLSGAFEETLVEPNMLVVDVEKLAASQQGGSQQQESWFSVDVRKPFAYAKVEVLEASEVKPSDLNGQLGPYRFRTKTARNTLSPNRQEMFRIPIMTWGATNVLEFEVRDKDQFIDDHLGNCCVDINDFRDGQRHDMWLPLQNVKMGRLHLRITVVEKGHISSSAGESENHGEEKNSSSKEIDKASVSSFFSEKSPRVKDTLESIYIEGQRGTAALVHRPGSGTPQIWEHHRGKNRRLDTNIQGEPTVSSAE
ncbi:C2 domain-containing protein At1g53590-like isoform X2 [Punica granatum]|uniref:C2 domain-containing protein At1g53590-like isoform X2 n=1 Tax=Punica granatum TaxID=22663 RepID=A0A6P8ED69_PUNGR|nr:C2 domain-containing protein At1g53590-like isoform X2 [Punica granatum]